LHIDDMTPAQWLDHLRSQQEHQRLFKWTQDLDNLISALPANQQQRARKVWEGRIGKTVGSILDEQFQSELESIKLVLDGIDLDILSQSHLGLFLTNDFNAWTGSDPTGVGRVVVLHEGIPHALIAWANCYVRFIELSSTDEIAALAIFPPTISYITSVWSSLVTRHPWRRPQNSENTTLSEELYFSSLCFIVAHEIGHMRLGHQGYTADSVSNHQMEFDADLHGLEVATKFALARASLCDDSLVYKLALFAPLFVMSLLSLFCNADSETHPSPGRRLENLIQNQEAVLRGVCKEHIGILLDFLDDDLFDVLSRNSRNLLMISTAYASEAGFPAVGSVNQLPSSFVRV
jgi:hypothetical protein